MIGRVRLRPRRLADADGPPRRRTGREAAIEDMRQLGQSIYTFVGGVAVLQDGRCLGYRSCFHRA